MDCLPFQEGFLGVSSSPSFSRRKGRPLHRSYIPRCRTSVSPLFHISFLRKFSFLRTTRAKSAVTCLPWTEKVLTNLNRLIKTFLPERKEPGITTRARCLSPPHGGDIKDLLPSNSALMEMCHSTLHKRPPQTLLILTNQGF